MVKIKKMEEILNNPEHTLETPEQKEVSDELKKMAEGLESDENKSKQEFRETENVVIKNDIVVGEKDVAVAKDLLDNMGIKFEVMRHTKEGKTEKGVLPGDYIFRLDKNDDDDFSTKVFEMLRKQKLDCEIIKQVVDLDKKEAK